MDPENVQEESRTVRLPFLIKFAVAGEVAAAEAVVVELTVAEIHVETDTVAVDCMVVWFVPDGIVIFEILAEAVADDRVRTDTETLVKVMRAGELLVTEGNVEEVELDIPEDFADGVAEDFTDGVVEDVAEDFVEDVVVIFLVVVEVVVEIVFAVVLAVVVEVDFVVVLRVVDVVVGKSRAGVAVTFLQTAEIADAFRSSNGVLLRWL